jgi:hypothetical protein
MASIPDLPSQLEWLLDAVWEAEANWRFDDFLDLASGALPIERSAPVVLPPAPPRRFPWYPGPLKGGFQ